MTSPYDVTSSRPRKTTIAFFANFEGQIIFACRTRAKFENYESVQHRLQFSGIKKGVKISFHRHFKGTQMITMFALEPKSDIACSKTLNHKLKKGIHLALKKNK